MTEFLLHHGFEKVTLSESMNEFSCVAPTLTEERKIRLTEEIFEYAGSIAQLTGDGKIVVGWIESVGLSEILFKNPK